MNVTGKLERALPTSSQKGKQKHSRRFSLATHSAWFTLLSFTRPHSWGRVYSQQIEYVVSLTSVSRWSWSLKAATFFYFSLYYDNTPVLRTDSCYKVFVHSREWMNLAQRLNDFCLKAYLLSFPRLLLANWKQLLKNPHNTFFGFHWSNNM